MATGPSTDPWDGVFLATTLAGLSAGVAVLSGGLTGAMARRVKARLGTLPPVAAWLLPAGRREVFGPALPWMPGLGVFTAVARAVAGIPGWPSRLCHPTARFTALSAAGTRGYERLRLPACRVPGRGR